MRILHLLASPFWSGPMENVALLAAAQRSLGHDVTVAIDQRREDSPAEELARPRLEAWGLLDDGGMALCVKSSPWELWKDARRLAARKVDVVHSHFTHDHYVSRLGRPRNARLVRSVHAPRSLRWSLPAADAYTVPFESCLRRRLGHRVSVLPALINAEFVPAPSRSEVRRALGLDGDPLVGMVSTFQPSRRHELGIEAFQELHQQLPSARLVLVGDGALEPTIRKQVQENGLESAVTFAGYQKGAEFVRWLQALDVVWILGLGNDWSGRAAAQARACTVRVVAVDEGALASWADEIVPIDPRAIVEATQGSSRRDRPVHSNAAIAADVLKLYAG